MMYLADSNVILRFADRRDPLHDAVRSATRTLWEGGHQILITPQNCAEFWNVVTRPTTRNGLGFGVAQADRLLRIVERLFLLLPDDARVYPVWRRLVVTFGISGVQVHDARLAAAMLVHGITHIITFNTADFARYHGAGIVAVDPATM
jgi:predicted nucleic acid-binding protein